MSDMNVIFTSAGRRVALVQCFRDAMVRLGYTGKLVTADLKNDAPARFAADAHELVPRVDHPGYVDSLLQICERYNIQLVVPLIDPELHILARHRPLFERVGVHLLVSSLEVMDIGFDKRATADFFNRIGVETPRILDTVTESDLPVLIKPARGSGGVGVHSVDSLEALAFYRRTLSEPIAQELLVGTEYTIDVLLDRKGSARSIVPRRRLEVRAGEVSKGQTTKSPRLIEAAKHVAESLPGAYGPVTLQCFHTDDDRIVFIEINPRFGGGFPLSDAAGARFPEWILQWLVGQDPLIGMDDWQDGLLMLRYDREFFVSSSEV